MPPGDESVQAERSDSAGMATGAGAAAIAIFFLANTLFGAGLFFHAFLYNFYIQALGHEEAVMGIAAAALSAGGLLALAPAGLAVDRLGVRNAYLGACVVATVGLAAGALVERAVPIYLAAAIGGAGAAGFRVSMGPALMRLAGPAVRARAFSWNTGILVASGAGWTAAAGGASAWMLPLMRDDPVIAHRAALLIGALVTLAAAAVAPLSLRHVARSDSHSHRTRTTGLRRLAIPRSLALLILVFGAFWTAGALALPFYNIFFQREHGMAIGRIGLILSVGQLLTAGAVFASGEAAARTGTGRMLLIWMFLLPPALWGLALAGSMGPAIAFYMLQAFVLPSVNPLIDQIVLERAAPERHGAVSSWRNLAIEGSGLVGATVGGYLLEASSFAGLFIPAGFLALAGGGFMAMLLARTNSSRA